MAHDEDVMVVFGDAVKAVGGGAIEGYLVLFSSPQDPDLSGDYFTKDTDFDIRDGERTTIYYNHGRDAVLGRRKIGTGALKVHDTGVWLQGQLDLRDKYERAVYDGLVAKGKAGLSSGSLPHLVEREDKGAAKWIKAWPLGKDSSITPTPAEPRTHCALALKSLPESPSLDDLVKDLPDETKAGDKAADKQPEETKQAEEPAGDETKDLDLGQTIGLVSDAVRQMIDGTTSYGPDKPWIDTYVFAAYVIFRRPEQGFFRRSYVLDGGKVVLGETETAVEQTWQPLKAVELPPTLGSLGELTMEDHSQSVHAAVSGWLERMRAIKALRAEKAGRVLSQMNRDRLSAMMEQMRQAVGAMHAMLEETAPPTDDGEGDEGTNTKKALDDLRRAVLLTEISLHEYV